MSTGLLLPDVDDVDGAEFWAATRRHELLVQACDACGALRHPPRPMCPVCQSVETTSEILSGRGTVWSYVIAHPPLLPAYAELAPYNVIVVDLDDAPGIRMVGNLIAAPGAPLNSVHGDIEIGAAVEVVFDDVDNEVTFPRWVLL